MASVRQVGDRWELRIYLGKDPLTGKPIAPQRTIDAPDKRTAERKAAVWEDEERERRRPKGKSGTFLQLLIEFVELNRRHWSPSTANEHLGIIDRYLGGLDPTVQRDHGLSRVGVTLIGTQTLDAFYASLQDHGGQCQHRPCPPQPCPGHPAAWCNRKGCGRRPCPGHPGPGCWRKDCVRPPCPIHRGRCSSWAPCAESPCRHGRPLDLATVKRVHVVVHAALEQAVTWEWGGIARNPAARCKFGELPETETATPTIFEFVRILVATEAVDEDLADFELMCASTGARPGAVHAVRISDIDLTTGEYDFPRVVVRGPDGIEVIPARRKKRSGRGILDVYALARTQALVRRRRERALACGIALAPDALLFSADVEGRVPWRPDSTSRRYRDITRSLGLGHFQLRALRNLMATVLLNAGVDPKTVAQRGGWKQVATMLDRYARSLDPSQVAAADTMGRLLAEALGR